MKIMKKLLSIFLAVCTLCTLLSFNVSAAQTEILPGKDLDSATKIPSYGVSYVSSLTEDNKDNWFKFTATVDGVYNVYIKNYNISASGGNRLWAEVYDKYYQLLGSVGYLAPNGSSNMSMELEKNITYYLYVHSGYAGNYEFIVSLPEVVKELSSISVTKPSKLSYNLGDSFDATGMVVKAKFSDKSSEVITDYTVSGFDSSSFGTKKITVTYTYEGVTKTASFDVTVRPLSPVVTATNVSSSGKIKLTWNAVDGAVQYKVYRATSKSGTYKLMKTTTSTSYINTSATAGKTYYYKVKAVAADGTTSKYSSVKTRTCDLARPTGVTIYLNSSNKPVVKWNAVDGATAYRVYRSTSKDGTYKLMKTVKDGTTYTNTSISHGTTYYYKVKAVCSKSAADSAYSSVVSKYVK